MLAVSGGAGAVSARGAASTPLGASTVVIDSDDGGRKVLITATPKASSVATAGEEGRAPAPVTPPWRLDVVVVEGPATSPTKISPLLLTLTNDAPVVTTRSEMVPLSSEPGATPRQSVGARVKASARPRGAGLEIDFRPRGERRRAIDRRRWGPKDHRARPRARGLRHTGGCFVGEEDGARYEVRLTAKRGD